jgi:mannan endo-1,4-beta-mannosidase
MAVFAVSTAHSAGFVERTGADFTLDGARWLFIGHNNYQLTSDRRANQCGRVLSNETVKKLFQQAKSAGATVVRTWFFQSYYVPEDNNPWEPFDRVLSAAARWGLKIIPVLVNHFPDCEPSRGRSKNERFYEVSFRQPGWGYPKSYKAWARMVARHYRNDSRIAFWQLVNEAETSSGGMCNQTPDPARFGNNVGRSANILRAFADEMVSTLKRVDPNHLVSLGTIGSGQCGAQEDEYQFVHAGMVDMCEYHDYEDVTQAIPDDGFNRLRQRITQCNALGKPLVVGEAGIVADVDDNGQSTGAITSETLERRAAFFDAKLSAAFAEGIDGYLIWEKIHNASTSSYNLTHGRFGVGPSDPLNAVTKQYPESESVVLLNPLEADFAAVGK